MQVVVAVILALGSVSALRSGPYLPSGWRPQGPAFYLPGEEKPADSPLKEAVVIEAEASGSDSFQEYGPPKSQEVVNVISQDLPEVITERTFLLIEDKGAITAVENLASDVNVETIAEIVEATTDAQLIEETATEVISRIADIALQDDITTALYADLKSEEVQESEVIKSEEIQATEAAVTEAVLAEAIQATEAIKIEEVQTKEAFNAEEIQTTVAAVEEKLEQVLVEEVSVEQSVKNIAEALVNLETEIKSEQVQTVEKSAELKISQEGSGSAQAPEGFLEYGPPGFKEYGPPKGDELLRSAAVFQDPSNFVSVESSDARRRRFSPKFKAPKNKRKN